MTLRTAATKSPFTSAFARRSPTQSSPANIRDGDPLPSVRALAAEQQANPLTVAKAYQGFQDEGLVIVKRGVGMFVAPGARARLRDSERKRFIEAEWPAIRERMERLGIEPSELDRARKRLGEFLRPSTIEQIRAERLRLPRAPALPAPLPT